ncbi:carboxylesterase family protein [Marinilactibacillus sp. GCM10026970]|uniref:carboxylesterase family protein n=1 Tax=Marinilactibacillus sp. GCM10026970 TaxID=3252642 RepID=UPI00361A8501
MKEKENQPAWTCASGKIIGWTDRKKGVLHASGIPYAHAKRFSKPLPIKRSEKTIQATSWAPASPQSDDPFTEQFISELPRKLTTSEHCQNLSITMPIGTQPTDHLPVMVWIHGGSYLNGAGDHPIYDPAILVKEQQVIVVTVTYRLGLLGYLEPANLGLLDQIEALKWIKMSIQAFGGDPENITVFGESAGGDAVAHLMIAEGTEGLFNRAIIQSAPFGLLQNRKEMRKAMREAVKTLSDDADMDTILEKQREVLEKAKSFGLKSSMAFGVQYGKYPLPDEAETLKAWQKAAQRIDVLIGSNSREITSFIPLIKSYQKLLAIPLIKESLIRILTHKIYRMGVKQFAKRHAESGGRVYQYKVSWGAPGNKFKGGHASEIPFLFEDRTIWEHGPLLEGTDWATFHDQGKQLREIWGNFARDGEVKTQKIENLIQIEQL